MFFIVKYHWEPSFMDNLLIEAKEKDKLSVQEIMKQFKCGKTQVYNTLKQKDKTMNEWLQGNGRMKRKAKVTSNEEINEVVWE
jgi:transposase